MASVIKVQALARATSRVLRQRLLATTVPLFTPVQAVKTPGFLAMICYFIQGSIYTVLLSG